MSHDQLDESLIEYAEKTQDYKKLQHLESDVLRTIRIRRYDNTLSWRENVISVFNFPQFQASALSLAFLLGIIVSPFFTDQLSNNNSYSEDFVSLKVFSAKAPYLTVNLIDTIK